MWRETAERAKGFVPKPSGARGERRHQQRKSKEEGGRREGEEEREKRERSQLCRNMRARQPPTTKDCPSARSPASKVAPSPSPPPPSPCFRPAGCSTQSLSAYEQRLVLDLFRFFREKKAAAGTHKTKRSDLGSKSGGRSDLSSDGAEVDDLTGGRKTGGQSEPTGPAERRGRGGCRGGQAEGKEGNDRRGAKRGGKDERRGSATWTAFAPSSSCPCEAQRPHLNLGWRAQAGSSHDSERGRSARDGRESKERACPARAAPRLPAGAGGLAAERAGRGATAREGRTGVHLGAEGRQRGRQHAGRRGPSGSVRDGRTACWAEKIEGSVVGVGSRATAKEAHGEGERCARQPSPPPAARRPPAPTPPSAARRFEFASPPPARPQRRRARGLARIARGLNRHAAFSGPRHRVDLQQQTPHAPKLAPHILVVDIVRVLDLAPDVDLRVHLDMGRKRRLLDRQPAFDKRKRNEERLGRVHGPLEGCRHNAGESVRGTTAGSSAAAAVAAGPTSELPTVKGSDVVRKPLASRLGLLGDEKSVVDVD